ncbi:MAG: hypothetical protein R6V60_10020 [Desulfobacterales bacterium]
MGYDLAGYLMKSDDLEKMEYFPKQIFALLYTPLHIRSLSQYLKLAPQGMEVYINYVNTPADDKRVQFYINNLRHNLSAHVLVKEKFYSTRNIFDVLSSLWLVRNNATLFTGNPRRSLSMWYAGFCPEIVVLEEGLGTTVQDGYFDLVVSEKSRLKSLAIKLGIISDYQTAVRKIKYHITSYRNSVFEPVFRIEFPITLDHETIGDFPDTVNIVVSSLNPDGPACYIKTINELVDQGMKIEHMFFSTHPRDVAKNIKAVHEATGITILDSPLILEDLCLALIDSGRNVVLYGDKNSSVLMLNQILDNNKNYQDCTKAK